jgi:hypothetical protein
MSYNKSPFVTNPFSRGFYYPGFSRCFGILGSFPERQCCECATGLQQFADVQRVLSAARACNQTSAGSTCKMQSDLVQRCVHVLDSYRTVEKRADCFLLFATCPFSRGSCCPDFSRCFGIVSQGISFPEGREFRCAAVCGSTIHFVSSVCMPPYIFTLLMQDAIKCGATLCALSQ